MILAIRSCSGLSTQEPPLAAVGASLPRPASPWGQHQFVDEPDELVNIDVESNVVLGAFAQNLLIDTDAVGSLPEVVGDRRIAPSNMERQLDHA